MYVLFTQPFLYLIMKIEEFLRTKGEHNKMCVNFSGREKLILYHSDFNCNRFDRLLIDQKYNFSLVQDLFIMPTGRYIFNPLG